MKTLISTLLITAFAAGSALAQSAMYTSAMNKEVSNIDTAGHASAYIQASNAFERIANAERKQWLPYYYAAYTQVIGYYMSASKGDVDDVCNHAEALINKADSLNPNNSEICTVKGYVNQLRIQKNPMMRGQKYGTIAAGFFQKAKELDPSNPRPYHLEAIGLLYRPAMFGGGKDKACPEFQKAQELFDAFRPASGIAPHWGSFYNKKMISENCSK